MKSALMRLALAAAVALGAAAKKPEPETELVELPRYKVVADWFTIHYLWTDRSGLVSAKIDQVTPHSPADRAGLRAGDELIAINGVTLAGLPFAQFNELFDAEIRPEHPKIYSFIGWRGFLSLKRRSWNLVVASRQDDSAPPSLPGPEDLLRHHR